MKSEKYLLNLITQRLLVIIVKTMWWNPEVERQIVVICREGRCRNGDKS